MEKYALFIQFYEHFSSVIVATNSIQTPVGGAIWPNCWSAYSSMQYSSIQHLHSHSP